MKKVLLITDVDFWQKSSGHRTRIGALVECLAVNTELTIVLSCPSSENESILCARYNAAFFFLEKNDYLDSDEYGMRLSAFLKDRHFDTVIIEYIHCSYFLNYLLEDVNVILDAHDIISNRAEEFAKHNYAGALYEISKETETEIFDVYDHIMVLCEPDYREVCTMTDPGKVLLCPHPVIPQCVPIKEEVKNIAFIASAYLPNKDAIDFFIDNCWPSIAEKYPVQLNIYGTVCYELQLSYNKNIMLKGFVADREQIYRNADIIINPVRFGAGLKIKNVEALAYGVPLVTTPHGARGMEAGAGNAFLVADSPGGFLASLEKLIESRPLREKLSKIAGLFIKDHFSVEKSFKPLLDAI